MNEGKEIQKLLMEKYMEGPQFRMDSQQSIGINLFSGTKESAFYELWGEQQIFRLLIIKPSEFLHTSQYVGKNHLLILLMDENEQIRSGGFISNFEEPEQDLRKAFEDKIDEEDIDELIELWERFIKEHYFEILTID